jgi:hypothetical protein
MCTVCGCDGTGESLADFALFVKRMFAIVAGPCLMNIPALWR